MTQQSFLSGADLATMACAGHELDPSQNKTWYIAQCAAVLLAALVFGPCSMSRARAQAGLAAPDWVDGRAAGAATLSLWRAGKIEPAGWFDRSPWPGCHAGPSRVWRLATVRP